MESLSRGSYYLVVGEKFKSLLQSSGFRLVSYGQARNFGWKTIYTCPHTGDLPQMEFLGPEEIFLENIEFEMFQYRDKLDINLNPECGAVAKKVFEYDIVDFCLKLLSCPFCWGRNKNWAREEDIEKYLGDVKYWL